MGSTLAAQSSPENPSCTCLYRDSYAARIRLARGQSAPWHGALGKTGNCACTCRQCDADRALFVAEVEALRNPPPTEAELAEQERDRQRLAMIRRSEQRKAEIEARNAVPDYQRRRAERAKAQWQRYQRLWEAEQARFFCMTIYRPTVNLSSLDGKHEYSARGTVAEQVAAIEKLVQMRAQEFGLFVFERFLCELDWTFVPPARKITRPAALKELLTRIIRQCLTENDDGEIKPALWRFTEEADMEPIEPDDLWPEALTQLIAAGRWIAPDIPRHQLPPGAVHAELLPGLVDQLRSLALEAPGNRWCGSKAALAELVGYDSVPALNAELGRLGPELVSCGIEIGPTGSRTGKSRAAEWFVMAKSDPLSLSNSQTGPDQDG